MLENAIKSFQNKLFNEIKKAHLVQNYNEVIRLSSEYLHKDKKNAWVYAYFANSLYFLGNLEEKKLAVQYLEQAIKLQPNEAELYSMIGLLYRDNCSSKSVKHYLKALELNPQCHSALYGFGVAHFMLGEIEQGIDLILKALSISGNLKYLEDLNHFIYYDPRFKNPDYKKIGNLFYNTAKQIHNIEAIKHEASRYNAEKEKIRLGFFCGEHLSTPTWPFLEKIFKHINRNKFELYCYSKPPRSVQIGKDDPNILEIQKIVDKWQNCNGIALLELVKQIHNDQIDILIDLSGYLPSIYSYYSEEPCLLVFMHKPAPVQLTWYGFWGTTGIPEIDYIITSEDNVSPSQDQHFSEKVYRLTSGYTHAEIFNDLPEIDTETAFEKNGYITFTSFSRLTKLNNHIFDLWSEILKKVPNSKFLIKYFLLEKEYMIDFIKKNFQKRGIDPERILIDPRRQKAKEFLEEYNKTDIAFEPIPFGGITTTLNSLTMGIPTIAKMEEDRVTTGGSVSLLKAIDCAELIANSDEEYIDIAVRLANNPEKLKEYKLNLRKKISNSSIQVDTYTKSIEKAFIDIWQDCCQRHNAVNI